MIETYFSAGLGGVYQLGCLNEPAQRLGQHGSVVVTTRKSRLPRDGGDQEACLVTWIL